MTLEIAQIEHGLVGFHPQKNMLYLWEAQTEEFSMPLREIHCFTNERHLLSMAFVVEFSEQKTLGLIVDASTMSQSDQSYYHYFDGYQPSAFIPEPDIQIDRLTGFDRARWVWQFSLPESPSEEMVDRFIYKAVQGHTDAIAHI